MVRKNDCSYIYIYIFFSQTCQYVTNQKCQEKKKKKSHVNYKSKLRLKCEEIIYNITKEKQRSIPS